MHLIYRAKKQALPLVNDPKLAAYYPQIHHSPTNSYFSRKKSIDVILDRTKPPPPNINDQILIYEKPRKTYRPSRTRKPDSTAYLKHPSKLDSDSKLDAKLLTRNRSTELNEKGEGGWRRRGEEYSPYMMAQSKKTRSNSKFRAREEEAGGRDWICEKFIENEVYAVEEPNDFI